MRLLVGACVLLSVCVARAQAPDGMMTPSEVDSLRDTAYVPTERVVAYEKILDWREKQMHDLMDRQHKVGFAEEMHDLMEQFGSIDDELNDNLDEYSAHHRDLRKLLPKLVQATERWSTALHAPVDDDHYNIARRAALDALKDTRELAEKMEAEQAEYFAAHPDAAKAEKEKLDAPHAPQ